MRAAVIGVGQIGSRVAARLAEGGVDVTVAASTLEHAQEAADTIGDGAKAASIVDAARDADAVVIAVMFDGIAAVVDELGDLLVGKVVIDPSNNIRPDGKGGMEDANTDGRSSGAKVSELLPDGAHYVKGFGTLGAARFEERTTDSGDKVALFYATDDATAEKAFVELAQAGGWDAVRAGGVADTGRIEVFGELHTFGGLNDRLLSRAEAEDLVKA